jgi:hypothetical protein
MITFGVKLFAYGNRLFRAYLYAEVATLACFAVDHNTRHIDASPCCAARGGANEILYSPILIFSTDYFRERFQEISKMNEMGHEIMADFA